MNHRKQTLNTTMLIVLGTATAVALATTLAPSLLEVTIGLLVLGLYAAAVMAYHYAEKCDRLSEDVLDLEMQLGSVLADPSIDNIILIKTWYTIWCDVAPTHPESNLIRGEN